MENINNRLYKAIIYGIQQSLNENFDIDENDLQYADDVDGNPDLMLGHLLRKQENSDENRYEYAIQQLKKIEELVNSGKKLLEVTYRWKATTKMEPIVELYNHIDCDIDNKDMEEFNIDVTTPVNEEDKITYRLSYVELYTNYCGPIGNMNIDRLLNGQTLVMSEDFGEFICGVKLIDK